MGGLLGVESEPGHGSTFSFTIYLTLPSEPYEDPVRAPLADLLDLPVLAVDDNATNRRILGQTLSSHGLCPTLSASGVEAMESLKHAVFAGNPYPLVIADAYMPHMDGFELVEAIRREPLFGNPALVLLTSGGRRGDGARCRELGVSAYLTKPVGEAELLEAILRVLGKKADPAAAAELITRHTIRETQRQLRVLVVDDNAVNRHLAIRLIEKQGHLVIPVSSGRAALAELAQHAFDLILMDVQMPEMDGFETTRAIRDRERLTGARVPIIAMTAHAMQGDRQRCLAAEMDEYVAKTPCGTRKTGFFPSDSYNRFPVLMPITWGNVSREPQADL
jgi:CheY-like chemotaxis protein